MYPELCSAAELLVVEGYRKTDINSSSPAGCGESLPNDGDDNHEKKEDAKRRVKEMYAKLQTEWTVLVASLCALAAIDSAITLRSADTVISPAARTMVIASGICAVFGILLVTWFIWKFCWTSAVASPEKFLRCALDVNGTYVSFALGSRIPAVLMVISALALAGYMTVVTYTTSKALFWSTCLPVLVVMWAQFPIWVFYKVVPLVTGGLNTCLERLRGRPRSPGAH
ncbi:hypothetical protein AAF712_002809 [Marasmius tenuissimus]|uniref:Transmembrane protein n=1 Tax=Marasmius tenuissimus TaxID=585030 RepID=A0ABR3A984_9AGAR